MKLIRNILLIATGLSMASCNYLDVNTDTKDRIHWKKSLPMKPIRNNGLPMHTVT